MFAFIKNILAGKSNNQGGKTARACKVNLKLEALENRLVPAGVSLIGNQVVIAGYNEASPDRVVVSRDDRGTASIYDDRVQISLTNPSHGAVEKTFELFRPGTVRGSYVPAVSLIEAKLFGGNDSFVNNTGLASRVHGGDGNDYLSGGTGADAIFGGSGADKILGNDGADTLDGGAGADYVYGGKGNDRLRARGTFSTLDGGDGIDVVFASANVHFALTNTQLAQTALPSNTLANRGVIWENPTQTPAQADTLANLEQAELRGGIGNNTIDASNFTGKFSAWGGAGHDFIFGGLGANYLHGGEGDDTLHGGKTYDCNYLFGDAGDDSLFLLRSFDSINGGGEKSHDKLPGGTGDDIIDVLYYLPWSSW